MDALFKPLLHALKGTLPTIGETERIALEAGTTWFEGQLFRGAPDFTWLEQFRVKPLTPAEQAFLDGPTEELCRLVDDWDVAARQDLPPAAWAYIKQQRFFGLIIPPEYGGRGFSAAGHAAVVTKLASKSVALAVTVMVPNSLGPGELLLRYGTDAQKTHYLPRLAKGDDIPCFGLTEPEAGSDAASGQSFGVVEYADWQGQRTLGVRLTFTKRYITLAPVATVVGLAFQLKDPENLLGKGTAPGITLALLPRSTPGLNIGQRHDPLGVGFMNGPLSGTDVFVPLDYLIGGAEYAGQGWRMLMEALAAGRGISLPSLSVGAAQVALRTTSAYAAVRQQFGLPIGKFEGVREPLARIAAQAYRITAVQRLTAGAVDAGQHPSVLSAIAKAYLTDGMRHSVTDAMDILGGAAIIQGSRNILARPYTSIPIGITVEGANILTRSLIVFGQGAIRCHPHLQTEVTALQTGNVPAFRRAFLGHVGYLTGNLLAALKLRKPAKLPERTPYRKFYKHLARLSTAYSLIAEAGLITLGGSLKRKEYLSGRYADALAHLFMASAVLKHAHDFGHPEHHRPVVVWLMWDSLHRAEAALFGVLANLPNRVVAKILKWLLFPRGPRYHAPYDFQTDAVVNTLLAPDGKLRNDLSRQIHLPDAETPGLGALEEAHRLALAAAPALAKLKKAQSLSDAQAAGLITPAEAQAIKAAITARKDVVQVDSFPTLGR